MFEGSMSVKYAYLEKLSCMICDRRTAMPPPPSRATDTIAP